MVETFVGHFQAELTLLYVLEPLTYNDLPFDATNLTKEQLQGYLAEELKHFSVDRVVLHGEAAHQIAGYAQSRNFDLIMLPTHGYGRFRRFILGSVAAKVLHDALCPVWTGVHMEQMPKLEDIAFRNIVCAIDLGQQSCRALRWASQFAAEFGANLKLVHAVPAVRYGDLQTQEKLIEQATARAQGIQESVDSTARVSILSDEIPEAVCTFAARDKADLLVIGRSVEEGMLGRLRTNAYSIIRQSPCPVVSV
jgi:nucleotide-binding universal stress UspA family protein